jgi:hypothetical protein
MGREESKNIKKYEEEIRKLQEELGLDRIELEFDNFSREEFLGIDIEFDDEAMEQRYRQAIHSNYDEDS